MRSITDLMKKERKKTFGMAALSYTLRACFRQENGGENEYVVFLQNNVILPGQN